MHALEAMLFSPLVPGLVLAIIMAVAWRRLTTLLRWLGSGLLLVCYLLWTPVGAVTLKRLLEHAADSVCAAPPPRAVVILAGGAASDAQPGDYTPHSAAPACGVPSVAWRCGGNNHPARYCCSAAGRRRSMAWPSPN